MQANKSNIVKVKGRGWVKEIHCGCDRKSIQWQYSEFRTLYAQLLRDAVFSYPVKNLARFDELSRLVTLSVALALHDAGITYAEGKKQDIGILGTNPDGALATNLAFFRDYTEHGRKLARGNLFIYTLPTSSLAEAAIHFGLQGPLLYLRNLDNPEARLLTHAELMIQNKEAHTLLAVVCDSRKTVCHVISGAVS
jgi:3-oxoacyl-(acyl-carrier-protein) synthase